MVNNGNKAKKSRVSCSVMVTGPRINLDLLTPYLVISPLDVFLFPLKMLTAYWRGKSTNITHSSVKKGALLFDIGTLLIIVVTSQHEVKKGKFVSSIY